MSRSDDLTELNEALMRGMLAGQGGSDLLCAYCQEHDIESVRAMLTHRRNPVTANCADEQGITPLMHVFVGETKTRPALPGAATASLELIRLLLKHGAADNINAQNHEGDTALTYATITFSKPDCIKLLLAHGADESIDTRNDEGNNPLTLATSFIDTRPSYADIFLSLLQHRTGGHVLPLFVLQNPTEEPKLQALVSCGMLLHARGGAKDIDLLATAAVSNKSAYDCLTLLRQGAGIFAQPKTLEAAYRLARCSSAFIDAHNKLRRLVRGESRRFSKHPSLAALHASLCKCVGGEQRLIINVCRYAVYRLSYAERQTNKGEKTRFDLLYPIDVALLQQMYREASFIATILPSELFGAYYALMERKHASPLSITPSTSRHRFFTLSRKRASYKKQLERLHASLTASVFDPPIVAFLTEAIDKSVAAETKTEATALTEENRVLLEKLLSEFPWEDTSKITGVDMHKLTQFAMAVAPLVLFDEDKLRSTMRRVLDCQERIRLTPAPAPAPFRA